MSRLVSPNTAGTVPLAEMEGHVLIVRPLEFERDRETDNGPRDVIHADVCDLSATNADGTPGVVMRGGIIYGRAIVPGLRRQIGQLAFGQVVKGVSSGGGRQAPWLLQDAMNNPQFVAYAEQWLDAHPEFEANGKPYPESAAGTAKPSAPAVSLGPGVVGPPGLPVTPAAALAAPSAPAPLPIPPASALGGLGSALAGAIGVTQPKPAQPEVIDVASLTEETKATLRALGVKV